MRHTINGHIRASKRHIKNPNSNVVFVTVWGSATEDCRLSLCYDIALEIFNNEDDSDGNLIWNLSLMMNIG